ncbi:MAG: L-lactate dehydrogenase [Chloroflexi bacterium]|nr:L-lactate dehydrogenase [Chloroflexota bacterium]
MSEPTVTPPTASAAPLPATPVAPEARAAHPTRVAVVGAGAVGSTFAFSLLLSGLAAEIVLVDANARKAEGEAMDLMHAVPFAHATRVWAGDIGDAAGAAITVVTAGAAQKPGETRLDLVKRNAAILGDIVPAVARANPDGIVLVASNPVDVLAYLAWRISGLPSGRVFGSGTILDTARFRALLAEHYGVDPRSVHAYIAGEHGDSEVPVWSAANIAGMPLADFAVANGMDDDPAVLRGIFERTRDAAYEIIARKGATNYAVGAGLLRIVEAILRDQSTVLSVSSLICDYYGIDDVYLSIPTVVGRGGVERTLRLGLSAEEASGLRRSAELLKETIAGLGLDRA